MKIEIATDSLPAANGESMNSAHSHTVRTGKIRRDSTKTSPVLCLIKLLRRSMCKFRRELNVHRHQPSFQYVVMTDNL